MAWLPKIIAQLGLLIILTQLVGCGTGGQVENGEPASSQSATQPQAPETTMWVTIRTNLNETQHNLWVIQSGHDDSYGPQKSVSDDGLTIYLGLELGHEYTIGAWPIVNYGTPPSVPLDLRTVPTQLDDLKLFYLIPPEAGQKFSHSR